MELTDSGCLVPVIAIDGPTASGKGTVARRVAKILGFHYLDSGVLYRAVAYSSLQAGIASKNVAQLVNIAKTLHLRADDGAIWLDGEEVSVVLREQACGQRASEIAVWPELREALLEYQRRCVVLPGLVADGRDMGTVVFPYANLKVFLTASTEVRAYRRFKQLLEQGFSANLSQIVHEIRLRDQRDSERAIAPLRRAQGAYLLDTSGLSVDQVVKKIVHRFT
ncbi:MAG: (d)CMP kinase [Pseudomonadota bacterium]